MSSQIPHVFTRVRVVNRDGGPVHSSKVFSSCSEAAFTTALYSELLHSLDLIHEDCHEAQLVGEPN